MRHPPPRLPPRLAVHRLTPPRHVMRHAATLTCDILHWKGVGRCKAVAPVKPRRAWTSSRLREGLFRGKRNEVAKCGSPRPRAHLPVPAPWPAPGQVSRAGAEEGSDRVPTWDVTTMANDGSFNDRRATALERSSTDPPERTKAADPKVDGPCRASEADQAATSALRRRAERIALPTAPKPTTIIAQVAGSGTAGISGNGLEAKLPLEVPRKAPG